MSAPKPQQNTRKLQGKPENLTNAGKGRVKGVPNKTTAAIKDMITQALANKGGVKYLEQQADLNPVAFLGLVGKVLPMQVTGEDGGAITVQILRMAD